MKKIIKLLLKGIGELLQACFNFPMLVFISDAFVYSWYFKYNKSAVMGGHYSI